eukprot:13969852-Alexandrium_andersonii.AAC.1
MSASLVGSEMCIRDRPSHTGPLKTEGAAARDTRRLAHPAVAVTARRTRAVSYTHLTLPTICSV